MGKLRSGRVKRIPQIGITSDRYEFLGLNQAEPNLGDPTVGPSSIGANPIPVGQVFQPVSVSTKEGERYWTPLVGFGTTVGVISVYENGFLPNGDNRFQRINGLNFVGTGVTVETTSVDGPFEGVGIATIRFELDRLINKGNIGQVIYNSPSGYVDGANDLTYYNSKVGIGSTTPNVKLDVVGDGNFTGIVTASYFSGTATTAINVIGGIGSLTSLSVSGITTLGFLTATNIVVSGIVTAPTFIGNLTGTATSVSGGTASVTSLIVNPGITTLGFLTGTDAYFTGIVTAQGFDTLGPTSFDNVNIGNLTVTGITTLGVTSASSLYITGITTLGITSATSLNVSGISTLGTVKISSGIITSSNPGVSTVFYYGDGSGLTNVNATSFSGIASTAKKLETSREFNITGDLVSTTISFDGTQNVSLASTLSSSININTSGIITATTFVGNLTGTATTATTAGTATTARDVIGGIGSISSLIVNPGITTLGFLTGTDAYFTGIVTAQGFVTLGPTSFDNVNIGNLTVTGISTLGTVKIYSSGDTGIITATSVGSTVFYYGDGSGLTGVIATSSTGIATIAKKLETERTFNISGNQFTAIGTSFDGTQDVTIGLSLATQSGVNSGVYGNSNTIPIFGVNSSGIITSTSSVTITTVSGNAGTATTARDVIGGIGSITSLSVSGITTLGTVKISSGIITATSGIVTYYGDGSKLSGINTGVSISTNTTNQSQYLTFAPSTGFTTEFGVSPTGLVFNPYSGNLGIGTTNPGEKLQVDGNIRVGISTTSNYIVFRGTYRDGLNATGEDQDAGLEKKYTHTFIGERIYDSSGPVEKSELLLFKGNDSDFITGPDRIRLAAGEIRFDTGTGKGTFEQVGTLPSITNKMILTGDGNLGIGITNPTRKLSINGDIGIGRSIYDSTNSPGTSGQVLQSTLTGIAWTDFTGTVTTATNVIGGIGSITSLSVSGITTLTTLNIGVIGSQTSGVVTTTTTTSNQVLDNLPTSTFQTARYQVSIACTGQLLTGSITSAGAGYAQSTYTNVALTGGTGNDATATIMTTSGGVTSVQILSTGSGYVIGNTLTSSLDAIGSGFIYTVSSVCRNYQSSDVMILHSVGSASTSCDYIEYATIANNDILGNFGADISGSNARLLFTPTYRNNTIKWVRSGIVT